jgi:hypothetical protein
VARLRERGLAFHVVAACDTSGVIDNGAFLCKRQRPWVEVNALARSLTVGARWLGVVLVQRCPNWEIPGDNLQDWGEYAAQVGDLVLFGEPQLLGKVVAALRD